MYHETKQQSQIENVFVGATHTNVGVKGQDEKMETEDLRVQEEEEEVECEFYELPDLGAESSSIPTVKEDTW